MCGKITAYNRYWSVFLEDTIILYYYYYYSYSLRYKVLSISILYSSCLCVYVRIMYGRFLREMIVIFWTFLSYTLLYMYYLYVHFVREISRSIVRRQFNISISLSVINSFVYGRFSVKNIITNITPSRAHKHILITKRNGNLKSPTND